MPGKIRKDEKVKTFQSSHRLLVIHGSTLVEQDYDGGKKKEQNRNGVEGGMLWARFTTEAQRIVARLRAFMQGYDL